MAPEVEEKKPLSLQEAIETLDTPIADVEDLKTLAEENGLDLDMLMEAFLLRNKPFGLSQPDILTGPVSSAFFNFILYDDE